MPHTILIVDDSTLIRHALCSYFEHQRGWQVSGEAENGQVAVEQARKLHPDVVILDLQMPVMNGLEAARQIISVAPNTAMVMFTLYKSEQVWEDAKAAGIRDVLSKSDEGPDHLLASLQNIVSSSPLLDLSDLPSCNEAYEGAD